MLQKQGVLTFRSFGDVETQVLWCFGEAWGPRFAMMVERRGRGREYQQRPRKIYVGKR